MSFNRTVTAGLLLLAGGPYATADLSPAELAERLEGGTAPLVVDVRDNDAYRDRHIPGAINIPGRVLSSRPLPRGRDIVLYGDGLGRVLAGRYAEDLRDGRTAEVLDGGLAAWESAGLQIAGNGRRMREEHIPGITYDRLLAAQDSGVTLVDLRERTASGGGAEPLSAESGEEELTDLSSVFPDAGIIRPASSASGGAVPLSAGGDARPLTSVAPENELLVLIDRGDGRAREKARELRASGNRRVVVLVGGEEILRHQGRPGLERISTPAGPIDAREIQQRGEGE